MEVIDGKQTNWEGLWWHPESNVFSSSALSLAQLRKFKGAVRLYVKKNVFFNHGQNGRPNYVFIMRDAKSDKFFEISVEDIDDEENKRPYCDDGIYYTGGGERLYTKENVEEIIEGAFWATKRGEVICPGDILPEDFV